MRTKIRPRSSQGDHFGIEGRPDGLPSELGASFGACERPNLRLGLLLDFGAGDGGGGGGVDSLIPP
jgi:hypothetical protein